ncbi:hypothetical protein GCM10010177_16000 [Actinomadura citrea]|nr:hypothetical protein GCM10010177_16000 [Actinomadura citrea]
MSNAGLVPDGAFARGGAGGGMVRATLAAATPPPSATEIAAVVVSKPSILVDISALLTRWELCSLSPRRYSQ